MSSAPGQVIFGRCCYFPDTDALFMIGNGIYNAEAEDLGAIKLRNAFVIHNDGTILVSRGQDTMCKLILNDNGSVTWQALPDYYS